MEPRYSEKMMRKHLLANYEKGEDSDTMKEMLELNKISVGLLKALPGPQVARGTKPVGASLSIPMDSSRGKLGDDALIHQTDPNGQFKTHNRIKGTPRSTPRSENPTLQMSEPPSSTFNSKMPHVPQLPVPKPTPAPVEGPTPRHLSQAGPETEGPMPHKFPQTGALEQVARTPAQQQ